MIIGQNMNLFSKYFLILCIFLGFGLEMRGQYDREVFYMRGRQALADGKYAQSIENFNVLARLDSTDHWTYFFRGIAKYNLGDVRGAQKDFDKSVKINPVFTNGYHYRAITFSRSGDYESALRDFDAALRLRPGYEGIYFSRGVTFFLAQRFNEAVADFDWYIRKQPKDPSAYLNRGASYLFMGDTTQALTDYNKAIKLDRFEPEGYVRRGRLRAAKGEYKDAIKDMDKAISLDTTSTFAYFNRAIMYYETDDYNSAMKDLDRVLKDEPGNALTLYNRSLIYARVGDFESALGDMDRVININPGNVLAYYNRASYFIQMGRWVDAVEDYTKAIDIYPDFAKAYMNRSYALRQMGEYGKASRDYETARRKIKEYHEKNSTSEGSFADTTKKYSSLLSLDADFAKKDFDDELLQHRDIDVRLRPLYKFVLAPSRNLGLVALSQKYENPLLEKFLRETPVPVALTSKDSLKCAISYVDLTDAATAAPPGMGDFLKGLYELSSRQFNMALSYYSQAVRNAPEADKYGKLYKAFYLMNRGVLRAEMIEFLSSIESNVQTLSMDDKGTTRARVKESVSRTYDYADALEDMRQAVALLPELPYLHFNLANLQCLSSQLVEAIDSYTEAIRLYPAMADAYFNRGLVQIYLKDKEKGCYDLSVAGELGVADAYGVINKYCEKKDE